MVMISEFLGNSVVIVHAVNDLNFIVSFFFLMHRNIYPNLNTRKIVLDSNLNFQWLEDALQKRHCSVQ